MKLRNDKINFDDFSESDMERVKSMEKRAEKGSMLGIAFAMMFSQLDEKEEHDAALFKAIQNYLHNSAARMYKDVKWLGQKLDQDDEEIKKRLAKLNEMLPDSIRRMGESFN